MEYNLGVDIGGTFTDCVVVDEAGELTVGKSLSTPDNFALGVLNAVRNAAEHLGMTGEEALLHTAKLFFHGCTVGDNTLLTPLGSQDRAHHHQGLRRQHLHDAGTHDRRTHRGRDRALLRPDQAGPTGAAEVDRRGQGARRLQGHGGGGAGPRRGGGRRRPAGGRGGDLGGGFAPVVHRQRQPREGAGRADPVTASRPVRESVLGSGALPGGVRAHHHHHLQRVHRPYHLVVPVQPEQLPCGQGAAQRAAHHAGLRRRARQRRLRAPGRGPGGVGAGGGRRRGPVLLRQDRRAQHPGHRHGRDHVQGGAGAGRPHREELQPGDPAPRRAGHQDLGGVHRRGGRQHRLGGQGEGALEGGAPGSRRQAGPGELRAGRHRAHGFGRGPRAGVPEPRLLPGRAHEPGPGSGGAGDPGEGGGSFGHEPHRGGQRPLPHHQCPDGGPDPPGHGGARPRSPELRAVRGRRGRTGALRPVRRGAGQSGRWWFP